MEDVIVVDTEIKHNIGGPEGYTWNDTDKLGLACAVVYEFVSDRFKIFYDRPEELEGLRMRISRCDKVVTFDGDQFDFPLIFEEPKQSSRIFGVASCDLLREIWRACGLDPTKFTKGHGGYGLDATCRRTIGRGKIGHGELAPKLYQSGRVGDLVTYCMDDVTLTRDLYLFMSRYEFVLDKNEQRMDICLQTKMR